MEEAGLLFLPFFFGFADEEAALLFFVAGDDEVSASFFDAGDEPTRLLLRFGGELLLALHVVVAGAGGETSSIFDSSSNDKC